MASPTQTRIRSNQLGLGFLLFIIGLWSALPRDVHAQSVLENPQPLSFQSGIGVISGWVCTATRVDIDFDNGAVTLQAAYGTSREDTRETCGDGENGFGLLFNWNILKDGVHIVRALADGVEFARTTVVVATLGEEVLRGVTGQFPLSNFPHAGRNNLSLQWQESAQNLVIRGGEPAASGGNTGDGHSAVLENPQPGSFQSGIGVISGWVCTATRVEIAFDGGQPLQAAYGTSRADTSGICGDDGNNGFGLLFNWNLLGDGSHTVRALADGVEFAQATFTVTTLGLGEQFPRGVSGAAQLSNFPVTGAETRVQWQESVQNFLITGATFPGSLPTVGGSQTTEAVPDGEGGMADFTATNPGLLDAAVLILQVLNRLQQASSPQSAIERGQETEGIFRARDDRLEFVQGGTRFTAADFQWLDAQGNPVNTDLAPGAVLNSTVTVRESSPLDFTAPFQLFYAGQLVFDFTAQASGQPQLSVAPIPLELNFGTVLVGEIAERSFTVINNGEGTLTGSVTTTAPFSIVGTGNFTLAAGQSQTIMVRFSPTSVGLASGSANVTSNGGSASVSLTGTGTGTGTQPQLDVGSDVIDFGNVNVGESLPLATTLLNNGTGTLTGTATTMPPFSIVEGSSFSVAPGQGQALTVRFTPTAEGQVTGQVNITSNGGNRTVSLIGTGT